MKKHANLSFFVPHNGCPQRCVFCNQIRISGASHTPTPDEVREVCERFLPELDENGHTEIAFFGGSFTAIDRSIQRSLLEAAAPFVTSGRACGIRLSTRPDAIDDEILGFLASYHVSAIELGAQSMDDEILAANKRGHSAQQVRAAHRLIREYGGGRFSPGLQMMIGMYGEKDAEAAALYTANEFVRLMPDTVRIYPCEVVENTELCDIYRAHGYEPLSVDAAAKITAQLLEIFERAGINVIRVGLHSDDSLRESAVAGPFHPAFGEICYSLQMRTRLEALYELAGRPDELRAAVNPGCVSRALGYKRSNVEYFAQRSCKLTVTSDDTVEFGQIKQTT